MAKPPESVNLGGSKIGLGDRPDLNSDSVDQLLMQLQEPQHREDALFLLSKKTSDQNLAHKVWSSSNTVYILLQEIVAVYKFLAPGELKYEDSIRACNAIALFQSVAYHPDTRMAFIKAKIPVYLYPLLNTKITEKPFEFLRLMSLGVLGALVKLEDPQVNPQDVVHFLLETEVFPLCLRCMDVGDELSKIVATFIVAKMLMQEEGLKYCCGFAERFYSVASLLQNMVNNMGKNSSPKLLKNIIRCYLQLSQVKRACQSLSDWFPEKLRDATFTSIIKEDPTAVKYLQYLLHNLASAQSSTQENIFDN